MKKDQKQNIIDSIKSELDSTSTIYITDCSGLDAISTSKLRRESVSYTHLRAHETQ